MKQYRFAFLLISIFVTFLSSAQKTDSWNAVLGGGDVLFKNCINNVYLTFSLKENWKIMCSGAEIIRTPYKSGVIKIIPNSPNVRLEIKEFDRLIWEKAFKVQLVPKPSLHFIDKCGSSRVWRDSLQIDFINSTKIVAKPNLYFQQMFPNESNYEITNCNIELYDWQDKMFISYDFRNDSLKRIITRDEMANTRYLKATITGYRLSPTRGLKEDVNFPLYILLSSFKNLQQNSIDSLKCPENFPRCGHGENY